MRGDSVSAGVIGPNAILQTAEALRAEGGEAMARRVFAAAGLAHMLDASPQVMVDEAAALALHKAVARALPPDRAEAVARDGGRRTGLYILAHRIPQRAQKVLRLLPPPVAGPILLGAIRHHAWTFAGSGTVETATRPEMHLTICANPLATPGCPWHRAVLETLFQSLVAPDISVTEDTCCASGARACRFVIRRGR